MINPAVSQLDKPQARVDKNRRSQDHTDMDRLTTLEARFDALLPTLATRADMLSVKSEILRIVGETHKWMLATVIGLFLGFGGLFLAVTNSLKPELRQSVQPVVIQLPAGQPQIPSKS
ncbi:hypothetical protein CFter6_3195 [Collimonas fungivorans]|uniref:Uncharacterized protein n=1 Tax=Collimonas fungivorans TaxID=158899 RepID=A0A127PDP5_9BURK|nr:hypothetical protein [Collimonas fungivorans]AMO95843.1 hypothetical protein CFter6_3195 [Collimonas fungivorans]